MILYFGLAWFSLGWYLPPPPRTPHAAGLPETCRALKRAAALFVWAYRVLEPHIHTHTAGSTERDVEAIGGGGGGGATVPIG